MATRAVVLSGRFVKVTLGLTSKVLGAGNYNVSGATRKTVEISEFGDDIDVFEFMTADGGTISLTDVLYDPTDAQQLAFVAACTTPLKLDNNSTSGLHLWVNSSSKLKVGSSGHILMTQAGGVDMQRNGMAKTSFNGQVSGAFMYLS